jgi:hypothetical protein
MLNRYHTSDPSHSARVELDLIPELLAAFTGKLTESEKQ